MKPVDVSKYDHLRNVVISHPDYLAIQSKERTKLRHFMALTGRIGTVNEPDPSEIEAAYGPALDEARQLIAKGRLLGLVLPSAELPNHTDQQPAEPTSPDQAPNASAAQNDQAANAGVTDAPEALGESQAPVLAGTPEQEPESEVNSIAPPDEDSTAANHAGVAPRAIEAAGEGASHDCEPEDRTDAHVDQSCAKSTGAPASAETHEYEFHPVAGLFPMMSESDLHRLADDIRENGLRDSIWLHQGMVIDGRNRYLACPLAGVERNYRHWDGEGSLITFVLSLNLHRRHLSDQQRALVAVRVKEEYEAEALKRSRSNLQQNRGSTEGTNRAPRSEGKSADRAAALLQVSASATKKAAKVLKDGAPGLVNAVELGAASLDAAALVATLPIAEQRGVIEQGRLKEKAKEIREAKRARKKDPLVQPQREPGSSNEGPAELITSLPSGTEGASCESPGCNDTSQSTTGSLTPANATVGGDHQEQPHRDDVASAPCSQTRVSYEDARRVVWDTLRKRPDIAANELQDLAETIGQDIWLRTPDRWENLDCLWDLARSELYDAAAHEHDKASRWVDDLSAAAYRIIEENVPESDISEPDDDEDHGAGQRAGRWDDIDAILADIEPVSSSK